MKKLKKFNLVGFMICVYILASKRNCHDFSCYQKDFNTLIFIQKLRDLNYLLDFENKDVEQKEKTD